MSIGYGKLDYFRTGPYVVGPVCNIDALVRFVSSQFFRGRFCCRFTLRLWVYRRFTKIKLHVQLIKVPDFIHFSG